MKKRIIVTMLAWIIGTAILVGCGNGNDASVLTPEASNSSETNVAMPEETPVTAATEAPKMTESESVNDDGFGRPPEDECVSDDWIGEEPTESTEVAITEPGEVEGIIILQANYKSNAFAPSFVVSAVNPDTGDYYTVSSFVFEHVARVNETESIIEPGYKLSRYSNYRDMFNEDFTLMAATKTFLSNEAQHAGWVDQSGEFFDLTVALNEQAQSDFDPIKYYNAVGFTQDGYFIYAEVTDYLHPTYYMVPLDNITPGASYEVSGDSSYVMDVYSDVWKWKSHYYITSWINENEFLAVNRSNGMSVCSRANISEQSITDIIPTGGSQTSWSPVIGPDGFSVAFLSTAQRGNDNPSIYLTDISGANAPSKLGTAYSPICGRVGDNGTVMEVISPAYYYTSILEWR